MIQLNGAVAIVTGASSGIGRATAIALAKKGALLVLASRNLAALEEVAELIRWRGQMPLVIPTDVTEPAQIESMINTVLEHHGQIDILVANSGEYIRAPVEQITLPVLEKSFQVNFYGAISAILGVLPHMLTRKSGHIVLVSTMDTRLALPLDAPYTAAKAALTGFGEVMRKELRGSGVSVTNVLPGRVDTAMIEHLRFHWISKKISPEAVARSIVRAIEQKQVEVIIPFQARLLNFVNLISPGMADWIIRHFHLEGWET